MADVSRPANRRQVQLTLTGERLVPDAASRHARVRKLVERYKRECWTRVMNRAQLLAAATPSYLIGRDLDAQLQRERWQAVQEPGTGGVVFNPDSYHDVQDRLRVRDYELTADEKGEYARLASRVRQALQERAESLAHDAAGADGGQAQAEVEMTVNVRRRHKKEKLPPS